MDEGLFFVGGFGILFLFAVIIKWMNSPPTAVAAAAQSSNNMTLFCIAVFVIVMFLSFAKIPQGEDKKKEN